MTSSMSSSFHSGWPGGRQLKVPQINTISEIESIITDRKRSLGQGNIFAPVCHSVHRVGSTWAGTPRAGTPPPPQQCMLGYGQQADGTHPTGMHSC